MGWSLYDIAGLLWSKSLFHPSTCLDKTEGFFNKLVINWSNIVKRHIWWTRTNKNNRLFRCVKLTLVLTYRFIHSGWKLRPSVLLRPCWLSSTANPWNKWSEWSLSLIIWCATLDSNYDAFETWCMWYQCCLLHLFQLSPNSLERQMMKSFCISPWNPFLLLKNILLQMCSSLWFAIFPPCVLKVLLSSSRFLYLHCVCVPFDLTILLCDLFFSCPCEWCRFALTTAEPFYMYHNVIKYLCNQD